MLFSFVGLIFLFEVSRETLGQGTLNWSVLVQHASAFPSGMMIACFALVFIGFAAKSGIFPFHTWLPEAHAKAPSAVSALLSGVLLNVGIYAIIRMVALVHQTAAISVVSPLLFLFGVLTIAIAAFSMLPQKNLKKLIAFSSIENMGVLLVGLAIATPVAMFWVIFYIMAHAFTKASLFLSAGILHRQYHSKFSAMPPMRSGTFSGSSPSPHGESSSADSRSSACPCSRSSSQNSSSFSSSGQSRCPPCCRSSCSSLRRPRFRLLRDQPFTQVSSAEAPLDMNSTYSGRHEDPGDPPARSHYILLGIRLYVRRNILLPPDRNGVDDSDEPDTITMILKIAGMKYVRKWPVGESTGGSVGCSNGEYYLEVREEEFIPHRRPCHPEICPYRTFLC